MPRIFAYIVHKSGVPDDTAAELAAAAAKIDAGAAADRDRHRLGRGPGHGLRQPPRPSTRRSGRSRMSPRLSQRRTRAQGAWSRVCRAGSIVLVPHAHFGIDLSPGLSIKLNAAYRPRRGGHRRRGRQRCCKVVRQEFGGQVSAHVRCDISSGAVVNVRPGAFQAVESAPASGPVVDKSAEVGTLTAGRRYLETIVAEAGDVDITKQPVLVSIGRGIQEQENVAIAEELAEALGAAVSCSRPVVDAKWLEKSRQVGSSGQDGEAEGLPGLRHQRLVPAPGRASRAIRSSSPSTRIPKRRSSGWRTWASWTTFWSSCRN